MTRESFEKAVEELEACVRNDWMGDDVSRADVRIARSRLLQLWDEGHSCAESECGWYKTTVKLRAEVERLRDSVPTEIEASRLLQMLQSMVPTFEWEKNLVVKLERRLSGSPREERSDG